MSIGKHLVEHAAIKNSIDAGRIKGKAVDNTAIGNGKALVYNSTTGKLEYSDIGTQLELDAHAADISNVHGIVDTSDLALKSLSLSQFTGTNLNQITTRSHTVLSDIGTNTHAQIDTHLANNSQAHTDYLKNDAADVGVALTLAGATSVPLTLNNSTGTQNIFVAQDNGSVVFTIADGGHIGIGAAPLSNSRLYAERTYTGTSGLGYGGSFNSYSNPASASSIYLVGIFGAAQTQGTANHTGTVEGLNFFGQHASSGTLTNANGLRTGVTNYSNANITTVYGVQSKLSCYFAGNITTGYGLGIAWSKLGAGVIPSCYGLIIDAMPAGFGSTVKYGVYSNERGYFETSEAQPVMILNQKSTGNILDCRDNGTSVFKVDDASKVGFFNVTTVAQQAGIVDADGTLADITTKFNSLLAKMESYGLLAVA